MTEEMIVKHCSPTLAGIKSGNMFTCTYQSKEEEMESIRQLNRRLVPRGLRLLPLRFSDNRVLIYLYRPSSLKRDLTDDLAITLLKKEGYTECDPTSCIIKLISKLRKHSDFPHEIGLFLGYPPEDVHGFVENKAGGYKYSGYWKVYGDEQAARRTFEKYRKCTEAYCSLWENGKTIERLAVTG